MADVNALTYKMLQDAVLGKRFPETSRTDAKRWLSTAYQDVWGAADWTFAHVTREALAITSGDNTPALPTTFADVIALYDDDGAKLLRLDQERFERTYGDVLVDATVGAPEAYMVVGRALYLAPIPDTTATFSLSYRRRMFFRTTGGVVSGGMMVNDSDIPGWDDHHSVLIPRASAIGLMELNDPTFGPLMDEYERQLSRMKDDYEMSRSAFQWAMSPRY